MNTTAFQGLTDKRENLEEHLEVVQRQYREERMRYHKNSERFTFIVLLTAGGELLLTALLFDYMIALNFVLTRIILWLLIALVIGGISRFMHLWIFITTHKTHSTQYHENRIAQRIDAIKDYENGIIDTQGIRMLYQEEELDRLPRLLRVSETVDWILYSGIILTSILLGLVFL